MAASPIYRTTVNIAGILAVLCATGCEPTKVDKAAEAAHSADAQRIASEKSVERVLVVGSKFEVYVVPAFRLLDIPTKQEWTIRIHGLQTAKEKFRIAVMDNVNGNQICTYNDTWGFSLD